MPAGAMRPAEAVVRAGETGPRRCSFRWVNWGGCFNPLPPVFGFKMEGSAVSSATRPGCGGCSAWVLPTAEGPRLGLWHDSKYTRPQAYCLFGKSAAHFTDWISANIGFLVLLGFRFFLALIRLAVFVGCLETNEHPPLAGHVI